MVSLKTGPYLIVLIEGDEITLDLYRRELSKSFTVFAFSELQGVVDVLAGEDIRAVVIEPEILSGKGWTLISAIREKFSRRTMPVIVCSTRDTPPADLAGEIACYLIKPVLPGLLREKTIEIIEKNERVPHTP